VSEYRIQYRTTLFPIRSGEVTLGRSSYASIVVNNPLASREHAVIRPVGERLELVDLGSKNGTLLNGRRVEGRAWLEAGDRIKIGTEILEIVRAPVQDPGALRVPTHPGRVGGHLEGETTVHWNRALDLAESLIDGCTEDSLRPTTAETIQQVLEEFLSGMSSSELGGRDLERVRRIVAVLGSWSLPAAFDDWRMSVEARLSSPEETVTR
jgi:pSer/pThr/pTyr-binding forkhead associated (FHA) protein